MTDIDGLDKLYGELSAPDREGFIKARFKNRRAIAWASVGMIGATHLVELGRMIAGQDPAVLNVILAIEAGLAFTYFVAAAVEHIAARI